MRIIIVSIFLFFIICGFTVLPLLYAGSLPDCAEVYFTEDNITVGKCRLNVYVAESERQKMCGMLSFSDSSFKKDGMIFIGDKPKANYFHTLGMKMEIRIMGLSKKGDKYYKVNNEAKYAPPGLKQVVIYGDSVFETSERLYQSELNKCLFSDGGYE